MQISRMLAVAIPLMIAATTTAEDFRFETDVVIGDEREPFAQHLTLFTGNLVYDFELGRPDEANVRQVTMLDTQKGRIVLMDVAQKRKTEVLTDTVLSFTAQIRQIALAKKNGLVALQFQTKANDDAKTIDISSDQVTYSVSAMNARQPDAVTRYREFADWYARLNAMRPGNPPPFGRLELNRQLAGRQWLPERITRTLVLNKVLRSRHEVSTKHIVGWQLTNTDRRRIQDAAGYQVNFQDVSLEKYFQAEQVTAR